ncbi:MAG: hypothetical protein A3D67_03710 [Candidatus Lloydbacteria bacterium RIFCSPHIGHO2_02_FULL_51_22]|uniref:Uncharacterized protein n=3 Tax=Candidatus Lloydiibacteriota TaxID=1817910 RepID=A0A1G2DAA1_9BACT|nr:MAG: hypothetical protein A3D67_03710 [Candidatus Lloydbacteria bacterium RIFCSPHIGHO2_02_FULL_51_22]OGZ14109.1 MAG: hypothetical protein A3J08_02110 [Candidatus Lloydbacteria bacterium RIFCSPLOWO2_02_FULL_51_11]OGZ16919.1 MAG: hypothetical protein A3G11_00370 [Candidatus Lloydbacteria bacterium RIFCSPLOWO2_12_FULL_51_9]
MSHGIESTPSSSEEKRLGRLEERFRHNPHERENYGWPAVIEWRDRSFVLHEVSRDGWALYDDPAGPSGGAVEVDTEGFVIGGHDVKFQGWPVVEEELNL